MKHVRHLIIIIFDEPLFLLDHSSISLSNKKYLLETKFTFLYEAIQSFARARIFLRIKFQIQIQFWFRSSLETISLTKRESTIPHNRAGFHRTTGPSPTTHRNRTQRHRSTCHHCRPSAFHAGKQPTAPSTPVNSTRVTRGGEACLLGKTLPEVSPVRGTKSRRAADLIINV